MDRTQDSAMDLSRKTLTVDRDHKSTIHESQPYHSYLFRTCSVQADKRDLNVSDHRLSTNQFSTVPQNKSRTAGKQQMGRSKTLQDKMDAIVRVHAGESKAGVARDIGVPESTLRGWCKAKEKISSQLNNTRPAGSYDQSKITLNDIMKNLGLQHSSVTPNRNLLTDTKRGSEKGEIKLSPKRRKLENNFLASDLFATAVMNTISMSNDEIYPAVTQALYRQIQYHLNNPCTDNLILPLNHSRYGSDQPPPSSSLPSAANLLVNNQQLQQFPTRINGAMENIFLLPADKIFSKSRKYDAVGLTSTVENPMEVATRSQSPNAGSIFESMNNQNSPTPSTSNNGHAITNTFTKSSKQSSRKWLHDISNQLRQQDVLLPVRECNTEEMISNNTMNNSNNNAHRVDNETTSLNSLPPESSDILAKFPEFVE